MRAPVIPGSSARVRFNNRVCFSEVQLTPENSLVICFIIPSLHLFLSNIISSPLSITPPEWKFFLSRINLNMKTAFQIELVEGLKVADNFLLTCPRSSQVPWLRILSSAFTKFLYWAGRANSHWFSLAIINYHFHSECSVNNLLPASGTEKWIFSNKTN